MDTYDKIPKNLIDRSTVLEKQLANGENTFNTRLLPDGHTQFSHLFCVILRIIIGILILSDKFSSKFIIILCILVILGFGLKFLTIYNDKNNIWKNYLKILINYSLVLFLQSSNIENKNQLSGLIVIFDSVMSQQSRFITTNMSRNAPL